MTVKEIPKEFLAAFAGGSLRVLYIFTMTEWWGRIAWLEVPTSLSMSELPYLKVVTARDILEREGVSYVEEDRVVQKSRSGFPWRVISGKKDFSFDDRSGPLRLKTVGPHKSIELISLTKRIILLSASHPRESKSS